MFSLQKISHRRRLELINVMSASESYASSLKTVQQITVFTFQNVFGEGSVWSLGMLPYCCVGLTGVFSATYTVITMNRYTAFQAFMNTLGVLQAFLKYLIVHDMRHLTGLLRHIQSFYDANSKIDSKHNRQCKEYANYSEWIVYTVPLTYAVCAVSVASAIAIESIFSNSPKPFLTFYLPNILNDESVGSIVLVQIFNFVLASVAIAAVVSCDTLMLLGFCNVKLIGNALVEEMNDFSGQKTGAVGSPSLMRQLVEIISMQRDYVKCARILKNACSHA